MKIEKGTLKELNVQPGDVVEGGCSDLGGGRYIRTVKSVDKGRVRYQEGGWDLYDSAEFRIVSRANPEPKTWDAMTDAEKVKSLAEALKSKRMFDISMEERAEQALTDVRAIKPEPTVETVTIPLWLELDEKVSFHCTMNTDSDEYSSGFRANLTKHTQPVSYTHLTLPTKRIV